MIAKLAMLFTVVTVLELTILIPLGQTLGTIPTVALVLGTAILGATLAKRQGLAIWQRIQKELASGKIPGDSLLDGLAVVVAGAFLLTPGVLTDVFGISLLIPPLRAPIKALLKRHAGDLVEGSSVTYVQGHAGDGSFEGSPFDGSFGNPFGDAANRQGRGDEDIIDVNSVDRDSEDNQNEEAEDAPIELPAGN